MPVGFLGQLYQGGMDGDSLGCGLFLLRWEHPASTVYLDIEDGIQPSPTEGSHLHQETQGRATGTLQQPQGLRVSPSPLRLYTGSLSRLEATPGVCRYQLPPNHPLPIEAQPLGVLSAWGQGVHVLEGRRTQTPNE
jgi:hypothetical protein